STLVGDVDVGRTGNRVQIVGAAEVPRVEVRQAVEGAGVGNLTSEHRSDGRHHPGVAIDGAKSVTDLHGGLRHQARDDRPEVGGAVVAQVGIARVDGRL